MHTASPSPRRFTRAISFVGLFSLLCLPLLAAPDAYGAGPVQVGPNTVFMPDLQSGERKSPAVFGPAGQEGFGDSEVAVQSLSDTSASLELELTPKSGTSPAKLKRTLGARKATRFLTREEAGVDAGFFSGKLSANQPVGAVTQVRWVSGAAAAYEAQPAVKESILPLVVREVYGHSSILSARNADGGNGTNVLTMTLFDPANGSILIESEAQLDSNATAGWDTANSPNTFGPGVLGSNSATGGWLGSAWFSGQQPVMVMAYGDEAEGNGSSAYGARPVSAANPIQYLPTVRANAFGDSLIAIANASGKAIDVAIEYRGAANSPSGAKQTFTQNLSIGPRGSAFVDLSSRQRGTVPSPALPRGAGADRGFVGSAVLRATGAILAVAQEAAVVNGTVDSVVAYNAFGPDDLGSEFAMPAVRKRADFLTSNLVLYNPGAGDVTATVDLFNASDLAVAALAVTVPAGSIEGVQLGRVNGFPEGQVGRATVRAAGALAALVYDLRDVVDSPGVEPLVVLLRDFGDSRISGKATLTERGADLEVAIELTGAPTSVALGATIRYGSCGSTIGTAYDLTNVTGGQSSTLLPNVGLDILTAGKFSIVVQQPGNRSEPPRDVTCGEVVEAATGETTDATAAWAIRTKAGGGPLVTPATPTDTPPPSATDTPHTPTPGPTTPGVPSPTATKGDGGKVHVYLPWARRP
jgi:hypothetical protein